MLCIVKDQTLAQSTDVSKSDELTWQSEKHHVSTPAAARAVECVDSSNNVTNLSFSVKHLLTANNSSPISEYWIQYCMFMCCLYLHDCWCWLQSGRHFIHLWKCFFCACNTINCWLFCFRFFFIFSGCMWDRLSWPRRFLVHVKLSHRIDLFLK